MANTINSPPPIENKSLLVGACELGMLESAWEYFVEKPKFQYIYVIDAANIAKVHALPPHNIAHIGVTGLLETPPASTRLNWRDAQAVRVHLTEQAKSYPLSLGLTEILARYIFKRRWSDGVAKMMFASQIGSVQRVLGAVNRAATQEATDTLARSGTSSNPLHQLQQRFLKNKQLNSRDFIDAVIEKLQDYLPFIYGNYSAVRQRLRLAEVLPFPQEAESEEATVFANSYKLLNELLAKADDVDSDEWRSVERGRQSWLDSISSGDDVDEDSAEETTRKENAQTLAQIEYINCKLREKSYPHRLVFLTTTGRLFESALKRYGVQSHDEKHTKNHASSRSSFQKCNYLKSYLLATRMNDAECDLDNLPFLDPRALMTSPDFVNFANHEISTGVETSGRAISTWLPAFFNNARHEDGSLDVRKLWHTYEYHQITAPNTSSSRIQKPLLVSDFADKQFSDLTVSWNQYIRTISAAASTDRLMQNKIFHDVRINLLTAETGMDTLQELMSERINDVMSKWLAAVGGTELDALINPAQSSTRMTDARRYRVVPNLILPAFANAQLSFQDLLLQLREAPNAIDKNKYRWLKAPLREDFSIDENDKYAELKTRYVQMLGQALLFAAVNNWEAAYRTSVQAYALATSIHTKAGANDDAQFITGREAAYFASVACRRKVCSHASVKYVVQDGKAWCVKYKDAVMKERNTLSKFENRVEVHLLRCRAEELAWMAYECLFQASIVNPKSLEKDFVAALRAGYKEVLRTATAIQFNGIDGIESYRAAFRYIRRQVSVMGIQIEVLVAKNIDEYGVDRPLLKTYVDTIADSICGDELSGLEKLVTDVGRRINEESVASLWEEKESVVVHAPFDEWRLEGLKAELNAQPKLA